MRTIKAFSNYSPVCFVNGGQQWIKRYDDGETALLVLYDAQICRRKVVDAFKSQEINFTKKDH